MDKLKIKKSPLQSERAKKSSIVIQRSALSVGALGETSSLPSAFWNPEKRN